MTNPKKQDKSKKPKIEVSRREPSGKKRPDLFAKFRNTEHPLDYIQPIVETSLPKEEEVNSDTSFLEAEPNPQYQIPLNDIDPSTSNTRQQKEPVNEKNPPAILTRKRNRWALLPKEGVNVVEGSAEKVTAKGFTSIDNHILDKVLRSLDVYDQVVLLRLLRLSHGFGKPTCKVSLPTLASACNITLPRLRKSLLVLEGLEHIARGETDNQNPNVFERGTFFTILLPMPVKRPLNAGYPSTVLTGQHHLPNKDIKELNKDYKSRPKHLDVGKPENGAYEVKPLDEQGIATAVEELREFAGDDDFDRFKKYYTAKDWKRISDDLEKELNK